MTDYYYDERKFKTYWCDLPDVWMGTLRRNKDLLKQHVVGKTSR